jgi:hypothetical protein
MIIPESNYPVETILCESIFSLQARLYGGLVTAENVLDVSHVMFYGFTGDGTGRDFAMVQSEHGYEIYKFFPVMNEFMEEQLQNNPSFAPYLEELMNRRSYDYFIVYGEHLLRISFEPYRLENMPDLSREAEGALFDEMIKSIRITLLEPETDSRLFEYETPFGNTATVIYNFLEIEETEARMFADMTCDFFMNMRLPLFFGGRAITSVSHIINMGMITNDYGERVFQVIAHCIFADEDSKTEVAVEYILRSAGISSDYPTLGGTDDLEWQVHDVYFYG